MKAASVALSMRMSVSFGLGVLLFHVKVTPVAAVPFAFKLDGDSARYYRRDLTPSLESHPSSS